MHKRVLLTGASGFVGSALTDMLANRPGLELSILARRPIVVAGSRTEVLVDCTDVAGVANVLARSRPDVVVHAAGRVQGTPLSLFTDNTVTTVALADAILRAIPEAVLIALGSAAEYGQPAAAGPLTEDAPPRPVSVYGHAKAAASAYLAASAARGLRHSLLRVFNLVGEVNTPAQVIGAFIAKASPLIGPSPRVELGRLDAVRDFVTLGDLGRVIDTLIDRGDWGHVLNVCSGRGWRIRDLISLMVRHSGRDYQVLERGEPPAHEDVVIGDPTRLSALTGGLRMDSLEDSLTRAWDHAVARQEYHRERTETTRR